MANHVSEKLMSSTQDAYRHPLMQQHSFKYYHPQVFVSDYSYHPNKGTKSWFQDYRHARCTEQILRRNLTSLQSPLKPTCFSDKPDVALGARKNQQESLFPIIHNNPVYSRSNVNHSKKMEQEHFMKDVSDHREQYKDLTGSLHQKIDKFYYPFTAKESFMQRNSNYYCITSFPTHHTAAKEFVCLKQREKSLVDYSHSDIW